MYDAYIARLHIKKSKFPIFRSVDRVELAKYYIRRYLSGRLDHISIPGTSTPICASPRFPPSRAPPPSGRATPSAHSTPRAALPPQPNGIRVPEAVLEQWSAAVDRVVAIPNFGSYSDKPEVAGRFRAARRSQERSRSG